MHLSTQAGWYDVNGNAVFIPANKKFSDDHPAVKQVPSVFEKISDDIPGGVKAAVAKAKAAATGAGKASDG